MTGHLAVKTASLDTKIGKRDEHLRSDDFFASGTYHAITFALAKIEPAATGVTVAGSLTVRDQSRPLTFPARATQTGEGEVCLDATVRIDRAEFGITFNKMNMSSMQNTITIHAVFTRG